jgi:hypothetical protein
MSPFVTFATLVEVIYCVILINDGRPLVVSPKLFLSVGVVIIAEQFYMWARNRNKR